MNAEPETDSLLVAAATQLLDEADSVEQLQVIGRRVAKETMCDTEREELRNVYRECLRAIDVTSPQGADQ